MSTRARIYGIDLIKIYACLCVVGLHVFGNNATILGMNNLDGQIISQVFYYAATPAIPLFFMVNGFFIINKKIESYQYPLKKIYRLFRVTVLWGMLLWLAKIVLHRQPFFFDDVFGGLIQRGHLFHFWFLGSLIILYVFAPLIGYLWRNHSQIYKSLLIILVIVCFSVDITSHVQHFPVQSLVVQTFRLWTWFSYYMLGGYLHSIINKKVNKRIVLFMLIISYLALIVYSIFNKHLIHIDFAEYNYDNILVFLTSILIFFVFANIPIKSRKQINFIKTASTVTMPIYILHPFVVDALIKILPYNSNIKVLVLYIATIISAFIISKVLEWVPSFKYLIQV